MQMYNVRYTAKHIHTKTVGRLEKSLHMTQCVLQTGRYRFKTYAANTEN